MARTHARGRFGAVVRASYVAIGLCACAKAPPAVSRQPTPNRRVRPPPPAQEGTSEAESAKPARSWTCRVAAEHAALPGLVVHVGEEQFSLDLEDAPVDVWLRQEAGDARVDVLGPVQFSTFHPIAELPLRVARVVELYGGLLTLGSGVRLQFRRVSGDRVEVAFDGNLALRAEPPPVVSCADLTLAFLGEARHSRAWRQCPEGARSVGLGPGLVPVAATPTAEPALWVEYAGPVEMLEEQEGRLRVRASWEADSRLDGWVPAARVRSEYEPIKFYTDGQHGGAGCGGATTELARVRRGAAVALSPDGPVWGRFATENVVETRRLLESDGWIPVRSVVGIRLDTCSMRAWVRASDLVYPADP
ncbi:MAG: hypothetical protein JW940_26060 [Polyangiaceae bacterium]|nr:hypothetical protein [Polyangiaceae bacterium]